MINTLIGQKTDQTQKFLENGDRIPVTKISVPDNTILQLKTLEKDGYSAVQIGAGTKKKANKANLGHAKKFGAGGAPLKIKEVAIEGEVSVEEIKSSNKIALDAVFKPGDVIQVSGVSKGKGFAGVVKRHGFAGGPKTHGQSDRHRAPGSIGQGTTPGRVYKGKKMAGRMGSDAVTIKNLVVVEVDSDENTLYVSGLIPGYKSSWVVISKIGEDKKFVPLLSDKADEESKEPEVIADDKPSVAKPADDGTEEKKEDSEAAGEKADETEAVSDQTSAESEKDVKASEANEVQGDAQEAEKEKPETDVTDAKEEASAAAKTAKTAEATVSATDGDNKAPEDKEQDAEKEVKKDA